jgi:M6 family metalloprotease-like protein
MKIRYFLIITGLLFSLITALGIVSSASAAPAAPVDLILVQPDGSTFTARQWGDEWLSGFETLTSHTIIQDENDWWVYADLSPDGSLIPYVAEGQTFQVGFAEPVSLAMNLRPQQSIPDDWLTSPPVFSDRSSGNRPILILLVSFGNRANTYPASHFQSITFGSSGSVKDFYLKSSFNQLNFIPAAETYGTTNDGVVGWLNLGYSHPNTGDSTGIANQQIVKDALIAANPYVNYAAFDTNGNGYISSNELQLLVVVAGFERAYSNQSPSIWAHRWSLNQVGPPNLDGVVIGDYYNNGGYSQIGEIHGDHAATFGVIAHELGHDIGWPDLYDISGVSDGVGNWDIMSGGSWNRVGSNYSGSSPALPNAWLKWYQGWLNPTAVNGTLTSQSIPQAATNPTAFLLRPNPNGVDWIFRQQSGVGEFFLVENRQLTSYDQGLPGSGLLIWHIDESVTFTNDANANYSRPLVKLMQADGLDHLSNRSNGNRGDAGDPYPGTSINRTFNYTSNPNSRLYNGQDSLVQVTNISNSAATMTATLTYSASPPTPPTNLTSTAISSSQINLNWSDNSSDETSFRVERSPNGTSSWVEIGNVSANTTSYANTGLSGCTTYYYRVRAHRSGDNVYSSYSNLSSATTTGCPLAAPSSLVTSVVSSSQINLSWSDNSSDETSFRVERSPNGTSSWVEIGNVSANTTSYANTGLSGCTTYYYRVRAHRSGDNVFSSYSNLSSATTTGCPLAAPSSLVTSVVSSSQINLSWSDNSSDETSFRVERSPNGTSSWVEIGNVSANTTSYANTGLSGCTTYYYRVRAHRSGDNVFSSYSNLSSATTTGCPLAAPSSLVTSVVSSSQINLSWSDNSSDETSFRVERSPNGTSSWVEIGNVSANTTSYANTGLSGCTTYYYRVRAHRSGDNVFSSYSNLSNATTTGCPLAAPSSLATSVVSSSQINLSWSDNSSDETSFRVERSPNGTSSWVEIGNVSANTTSYANTGLSSCTTYYYRVRAHRSGDNVFSSYSNLSSATTTGCPLAAPSSLLASDGTYTDRVYISWSGVSGATSYQVFRCTTTSTSSCGTALSSPSTTNYNDYGATAGVTYYYRAKACNSTGCSDYSTADPGFRSLPSVHNIFLPLVVSGGGTTSTIRNGGFK